MQRRSFLLAVFLGAWVPPAFAHTPYRQWQVMRERFLLIHTSRTDPASDEWGDRIAAALEQTLPEARAMVARTPDEIRIASLLHTGQARVAVLSVENALAMNAGRERFAEIGQVDMHLLAAFDRHLWVCRPDFPEHHAFLLASAIAEHPSLQAKFVVDAPNNAQPLTLHSGVAAFTRGDPVPPPK